MARRAKVYTVSDGDLVLELREAGKGWYAVSVPLDPTVHTQARSIPEAFRMARDAMKGLRKARAKYYRILQQAMVGAHGSGL